MRAKDRSEYWFLILCLLLIIAALAPGDAFASGDRITQSNDNNAQTTGDVSVSDSSEALGFSHSLGDVDINDCLASTQWGTIIVSRQRVVLNKWCAAEVYDYKGLHSVAARLRCDIKEVSDLFQTESECITANTVRNEEPEVPRGTSDELNTAFDSLNALESRLNELESRNSELQSQYDALEARRQASIRAARDAREDERAYARNLAEELSDE